jgi:hypothetical protein
MLLNVFRSNLLCGWVARRIYRIYNIQCVKDDFALSANSDWR